MTRTWMLILALAPACSPQNLYVAHDTVVGINASVNQGRQQGQLVIGYDRDFATIIPKSVGSGDEKDVMALLNCTELVVKGIYLDKYSDVMFTGAAARSNAAKVAPDLLDCNAEPTPKQ